MFAAYVALILAVPAPKLPDGVSLECKIHRTYIGAILDFEYSLTIGGPDKKTWRYEMIDRQILLPNPVVTTTEGTYDVDGEIALFTVAATDKTPAARFGVNFRRQDKEVFFDAFFPGKDGRMTYARQWHENRKDRWQLVESLTLSFIAPDAKSLPKTWEAHFRGEHAVIAEDGTFKKTAIDRREGYKEHSPKYYARTGDGAVPWWLSPEMLFDVRDGRVVRASFRPPTLYDANGFHPRLHVRPGK
jgi:hypothetical protein